MTVRRVVGLETEFGIFAPEKPHASAIELSQAIVEGYRRAHAAPLPRWSYEGERPLDDARGFTVPRAAAHPSQLTDRPGQLARLSDLGGELSLSSPSTGAALPNGARLYVDHAHPEYSAPEALTPAEAVVYDRAGEQIARVAAEEASRALSTPVVAYKNNTDGKGASYGAHESYLVERAVPFERIVALLTPHFVTRQVYAGAGRRWPRARC